MTSATARPRSTGWQLSSVPWITSTGQARFASASRASSSSTRSRSACEPDGEGLRVGLQRPRHHVLVRLGRVRLGEHERGVVLHPLLVAADPPRMGHVLDDVVVGEGQRHRRRYRDDSEHPLRRDVRQVERPARATAEGHEERRIDAEVVHHRGDVTDVECVGLVGGRGRPAGQAVAPWVDRDHPEVARQVRDLRLPLPPVDHREATQHHHRGRPGAEDLVVDRDAVAVEVSDLIGLTRSHDRSPPP